MKVLIVGDSPQLKTGFGRVNAEAARAFLTKGWEVASLGGLTDATTKLSEEFGKVYTPSGYNGDVWGFHDVPDVIEDYDPDIIYATADPGTFVTASSVIPDSELLMGYVPIEGEPIANWQWRRMLPRIPFFTCSKYGTKVVRDSLGFDVDYVYHGVDHETFNTQPRLNGMRDLVREKQRWDGKFVITTVGTNVRRKQIPRIIEAVSILKHEYKQNDIVLYIHTVPYQHYWLDGWNLPEITSMYGVADICFFNPLMDKFNAHVPELTGEPSSPGLVEIYNASDLFVLASQVEGFGLPIAEAMSCGLPVIVPKYAAGWEVASPAGRGVPIKDWEIHKTATRYGNIDPHDLAKEILRVKRNPKDAQRMSDLGLERAKDFSWPAFREKVVLEVEEVVNADITSRSEPEASDSAEEARQGQGDNRFFSGEEALPQNDVQPSREGEVGDG